MADFNNSKKSLLAWVAVVNNISTPKCTYKRTYYNRVSACGIINIFRIKGSMDNPTLNPTHAVDWRQQLKANGRRTTWVITLYFLIYIMIGLLVDTYLHLSQATPSLSSTLAALISFQIIPKATLFMILVAAISLWVTFAFGDRLMLLGTEYQEVTPASESLEEKQLYNVV